MKFSGVFVLKTVYLLFCFSGNSQCQELKDELKRVKRQLASKAGGVSTPQSKYSIRKIIE